MPPIKHIVVLMLENRSFDHMVGFMQSLTYPIDGIDAAHPPTNPTGLHDPTLVPATCDAGDTTPPFDPGHAVPDVNVQLFFNSSGPPPVGASNQGFATATRNGRG
jgi:phospholipase C